MLGFESLNKDHNKAEKGKRGIKEENAAAPAVNTGSIPNPTVTAMGPRKKKKDLYAKFKEVNATDRRYKPEKTVLLQRFKQFAAEK